MQKREQTLGYIEGEVGGGPGHRVTECGLTRNRQNF